MLGVKRKPAWMAALTALGVAFVLALTAYHMPVQLAVMSTADGAAYGIFPIAWIVFASIMLYRLAVDTGKFEIIKDSVGGLTNDRRLQALFIAFSFGAFIEGAAGFRRARGGLRRDARGPRLLAVLRGRHLPAGQHRAGGVRIHRHSHRHAGRHHRPAGDGAERDGGPAVRDDLRDHPGVLADRDGRLRENVRSAAGRRRVRVVVRRRAVLRLELHGPGADRHPELADLHRLHGARAEVLEAEEHFPARR